eukprot:5523114-Amphidinium_carterae.1
MRAQVARNTPLQPVSGSWWRRNNLQCMQSQARTDNHASSITHVTIADIAAFSFIVSQHVNCLATLISINLLTLRIA